eukprot:372835-Hanusia_phi.AAC.1
MTPNGDSLDTPMYLTCKRIPHKLDNMEVQQAKEEEEEEELEVDCNLALPDQLVKLHHTSNDSLRSINKVQL